MVETSIPELKFFLGHTPVTNEAVVAVYKNPADESTEQIDLLKNTDCVFFRKAALLDQRDIALARMIAAAPKMFLMLNKLALDSDSIELFNEAQDLIREVLGK